MCLDEAMSRFVRGSGSPTLLIRHMIETTRQDANAAKWFAWNQKRLAERVGFFPSASRILNKDRDFESKSHDASNLALAASSPAFVCRRCFRDLQRNVTRDVTRRERLAQSPAHGNVVIR